ncbi:prepilin-type N-terminal cleavage/methylation domain-containing protein [Litoribrevibacter albus]|uniref:Type IV pilus modification protein PilV n=1 Tax=Litoribrevibacter albus TaxID=1473156 RepID=A0AA37SFK9_9GAMM|nr:prepilin-type N-terminal cleavage/methylation domain-containing protein [Litoribrevibacter albus]GLQ33677.1 hypothetical protein GCM10007876_41570 [Litoribrevibacter albus]
MLRKSGFSLIELLVALLLISITLLGTARLQMAAQQQLDRGFYTAQALALIEEASRRIYLNYDQRNAYQVNDLSNLSSVTCNPCSPQELVRLDLSHLSENLHTLFPSANASIRRCENTLCMSVAWFGAGTEHCDQEQDCIERFLL